MPLTQKSSYFTGLLQFHNLPLLIFHKVLEHNLLHFIAHFSSCCHKKGDSYCQSCQVVFPHNSGLVKAVISSLPETFIYSEYVTLGLSAHLTTALKHATGHRSPWLQDLGERIFLVFTKRF